ncbi:AraC family transcriptional regulator [Aquimarina gracilis]|uniref:AraC family transcriptional regulator n=1 Tax=Aquimarina gracilis TaxID=874422 RepID=A0ABU5ZVN6_9FLAO|nr:AraC family transcriptional regulator [Aquimarina gracilis]MEB3345934.1 AraC family transcriptional regulator [Aquimarina gracilis]
MTTIVKSPHNAVPSEFYELQKILDGKIVKNQDVYTISTNSALGKGAVRYIHLQPGLQAYDFDITLHENLEIPISRVSFTSLQFLYCLEGDCSHQFEDLDKIHLIDQFQTAVIHSNKGLESRIFVKAGKRLVLNIIAVNKKEYFDKFSNESNKFGKRIQELLYQIGNKQKHFHLGSHSLKIAEQLKLLIGLEYDNEISEMLSQKGRYYLILAKHIEQFCLEVDNNTNTSGLLKNELKMITQMSDFIKQYPEIQHSIKTLCLESGLSPAKLQEGFKFMYNRTVSDFVRNTRLDKAEKLIRTTDLTISEIVYTVGLTSRSYFCKIFKKKYRYSPKEYKIKSASSISS